MGITSSFTAISDDDIQMLMDNPEAVGDFILEYENATVPECDMDKSIDGIQFLLHQARVDVAVAPTEMPGEFIESDDDEGEIFGFSATAVAEIAGKLGSTSFDVLAPHFDPAAMESAQVYPSGWGDSYDVDDLAEYYADLQQFFTSSATNGLGALLTSG